jgi:hypothetical protein
MARTRLYPDTPLVKFYAEVFAAKILDWNIRDASGQKRKVDSGTIERLDPDFFDILRDKLKQRVEQVKN